MNAAAPSIDRASVLVTGAHGLLGSRLMQALARLHPGGRHVPAGRRPTAGGVALDLAGPGIQLPEGLDMVINVAGEKRDETLMRQVNEEGAARLVGAAAAAGVRRFVHVSSVGVYGAAGLDALVGPAHAHTPRNAYEASKSAGEARVRRLCAQHGLQCVVVQPSTVLAHVPGQTYPLLGLMANLRRGRFAYFGDGQAWLNHVHVDDVAAAVAVAALRGRDGAIYIVNTPARLPQVVGWICDELGCPPPRRHVPAWLGRAAAAVGSGMQGLAGRPMPINRERFLEMTSKTRFDDGGLAGDTGFAYPLGIEAAVRGFARAYVNEGKL